jgi:hypothetical protein
MLKVSQLSALSFYLLAVSNNRYNRRRPGRRATLTPKEQQQ